MKSIFELDQSNRSVLTSLIRQSIADRWGKTPHDYLWRDLRRAAGIPDQRHLVTQFQGYLLWAIALHWEQLGSIPTSDLARNRWANECLAAWGDPSQMFNALGGRLVSKAELLDIIESETGKRPCDRTLRRWRSKVSPERRWRNNGAYTATQVQRILHAAEQSSCRRSA